MSRIRLSSSETYSHESSASHLQEITQERLQKCLVGVSVHYTRPPRAATNPAAFRPAALDSSLLALPPPPPTSSVLVSRPSLPLVGLLLLEKLGVTPRCDQYLELWPPGFETYNVMVPNLFDIPFCDFGVGTLTPDLRSIPAYVSSRYVYMRVVLCKKQC